MKIHLPPLHASQKEVNRNKKRFNVLSCGRRYGKNEYGVRKVLGTLIKDNSYVGWYEPTYDSSTQQWKDFVNLLEPITESKHESFRNLYLANGSRLDFWSLKNINASRGRKYHRVVINEGAFIPRLTEAWQQTIQPTLLDYTGDAFLMSTPKGTDNDWYSFYQKKGQEDWAVFDLPTSANPLMPKAEIERLRRTLPDNVFQQEYEAKFIDFNAERFFWGYADDQHYTDEEFDFIKTEPVWISFDFNYEPCVCTVYQVVPGFGIYGMREFEAIGGTRELCKVIKESDLMTVDRGLWLVTGDKSGTSKSAVSGHVNNFDILQDELGLRDDQIINTEGRNRSHEYSRTLCCEFFFSCPFWMDKRMIKLRNDLKRAKPNQAGKLHKNRGEGYPMDHADTFRYFVDGKFWHGPNSIKQFASECVNSKAA